MAPGEFLNFGDANGRGGLFEDPATNSGALLRAPISREA